MNHSSDAATNAAAALIAGFSLVWFVGAAAVFVLALVANWRIASKAGYAGALSLLMLIPVVNGIVFLIFAFSRWPVEIERDALRARQPGEHPVGTLVV